MAAGAGCGVVKDAGIGQLAHMGSPRALGPTTLLITSIRAVLIPFG